MISFFLSGGTIREFSIFHSRTTVDDGGVASEGGRARRVRDFKRISKLFCIVELVPWPLIFSELIRRDRVDALKNPFFVKKGEENHTFPWIFCSFSVDLGKEIDKKKERKRKEKKRKEKQKKKKKKKKKNLKF